MRSSNHAPSRAAPLGSTLALAYYAVRVNSRLDRPAIKWLAVRHGSSASSQRSVSRLLHVASRRPSVACTSSRFQNTGRPFLRYQTDGGYQDPSQEASGQDKAQATASATSQDSGPQLRKVDPSRWPIASIEKADGNGTTLSLHIPHSPGTNPHKINPVKNRSESRYKADRKRKRVELAVIENTSQPGKVSDLTEPWKAMLYRLDRETLLPSSNWTTMVFRGTQWQLLELYHYTLSTHRRLATAEYPELYFDSGSMTITASQDSIPDIERRNLELQSETEQDLAATTEGQRANQDERFSISSSSHSALNSSTPSGADIRHNKKNRLPSFHRSKAGFWHYIREVTLEPRPKMVTNLDLEASRIDRLLTLVLFDSASIRPYISFVALHQAFSFLVKRRKFRSAKQFLLRMRDIGFHPNVEFYNCLLESCAIDQAQRSFTKVFGEMNTRGIPPNDGSWASLLNSAPTTEVYRLTTNLMHVRGFLKKAMRSQGRGSTAHVFAEGFGKFLDAGGATEVFYSVLDDLFGSAWPNTGASSALLDALANRLRMIEAFEAAQYIVEKNVSATDNIGRVCLHRLLVHCNHQRNADFAIWLTVYAHRHWGVHPENHIILDLLFRVARKARMYNVLYVIWRFAIARGQAGYWMRCFVYGSLMSRAQLENDMATTEQSVNGQWKASFGTVLTQLDPLLQPEFTPHKILNIERDSFGETVPAVPFLPMLAAAMERDKEWAAEGLKGAGTSTEWKRKEVIHVPMKPNLPTRRRYVEVKDPFVGDFSFI